MRYYNHLPHVFTMKFILFITFIVFFNHIAATQNSSQEDSSISDKVFEKVDIEAAFPGGDVA